SFGGFCMVHSFNPMRRLPPYSAPPGSARHEPSLAEVPIGCCQRLFPPKPALFTPGVANACGRAALGCKPPKASAIGSPFDSEHGLSQPGIMSCRYAVAEYPIHFDLRSVADFLPFGLISNFDVGDPLRSTR